MDDNFKASLYSPIYYAQQLKAVKAILEESDEFFYRKICRWYSKEFNTELTEVYKLPFPFLLQHYYEDRLDEMDYNELYDFACAELLPEFMKQREDEDQAFADSLIEEQKRTLEAKAKRDKAKRIKEEALQKAQEEAFKRDQASVIKTTGDKHTDDPSHSERVSEVKRQSLNQPDKPSKGPNTEPIEMTFDDLDEES